MSFTSTSGEIGEEDGGGGEGSDPNVPRRASLDNEDSNGSASEASVAAAAAAGTKRSIQNQRRRGSDSRPGTDGGVDSDSVDIDPKRLRTSSSSLDDDNDTTAAPSGGRRRGENTVTPFDSSNDAGDDDGPVTPSGGTAADADDTDDRKLPPPQSHSRAISHDRPTAAQSEIETSQPSTEPISSPTTTITATTAGVMNTTAPSTVAVPAPYNDAARTASSSGSGSGSGGGWGDQDEYDQMPKTPMGPSSESYHRSTMLRRQSSGGASAASSTSDLSSAGGASNSGTDNDDMSRTMSPALYVPEVPPAPPSTPASTTPYAVCTGGGDGGGGGGRHVLHRDFGSATPLPYYNISTQFVQNARLLERQQLLADGAVTPAPQGRTSSIGSFSDLPSSRTKMMSTMIDDGAMTPHADSGGTTATTAAANEAAAAAAVSGVPSASSGSIPKKPRDSLIDDFSEWAVGDRYQLERMLGRGSYGEVAQAVDLQRSVGAGTSSPAAPFYVAIKRIQSPFHQEVDAVRLFRELHILRRLRGHDCIIKLLDVIPPPSDDLDDFHDLYLVFEYVDTDLYKLIMSPQYLTTEHIQTFLYQMLAGLKYIHSANCIHRDLKPANILLNEDCSLKICDFGLARIVDESAVIHTSDQDSNEKKMGMSTALPPSFAGLSPKKQPLQRQLTKHVVTRWYRAPELILIQPYTTAVDIWSLGCIFAELLSMQEGSVPGYQDRTPLFPGGACYPLSGDTDNAERLDQLSVIFGVIGTPSLDDVKLVGKASEYIKQMGTMKPKKFESLYPAADPVAIDLLEKMLKFNPRQRITASEALDHEFFRGIRRKEMETTIEKPLESPSFLHEHYIDIDVLKRKTYEEVLFKDEGQSDQAQATTT